MDTLFFVTSNEGKIKEAKEILGFPIEVAKLELDEIQSLQLEDIVTHKVKQAYEKIQKPVIVDDVGLYIEDWGGFPGPFIKFLIESGGNELLINMMKSALSRKVVAKAAIGFYNGTNLKTFIGEINGTISEEPLGDNGWGWDNVFIPEHSDKTYAQMTSEEKNQMSHRRAALEKLREFLNTE